jgi:CBS domain-containing protein
MVEHGISGLPVVDANRRVLGVVSEADIVSGEAAGTGKQGMVARARAIADPSAVAIPRTAGEAMSSPAVTIQPEEPIMQAAHRIAGSGVNRLPVVDEDERLVGIITRADIVRAFARSDEEIAEGVQEVIQRLVGRGSDTVQVAVADGVVILSGEVDTETNARLVAFFASRLPGVVSVRSHLWAPEEDEEPGENATGPSS